MDLSPPMVDPPSRCGYLPDRAWRLEFQMAYDLSAEDYAGRLLQGWRHFGRVLFQVPDTEIQREALAPAGGIAPLDHFGTGRGGDAHRVIGAIISDDEQPIGRQELWQQILQ